MTVALTEGLKNYLVSNVAALTDTNVFVGWMPDKPDNLVGIYDRGGPPPDSKLTYDEKSIQFVIRGMQVWPMDIGQIIFDRLHGITDIRINGVWIVSCLAQNAGPAFIGRDAAQRPEYSLNFNIEVLNEDPISPRVGG